MVNRDIVLIKLSELSGYISAVEQDTPPPSESATLDRRTLDLVAFNLMLSVQCCIDIASHIIADEQWPAVQAYGQAFERLGEHGVLSANIANSLRQAVGLRNAIAHGYAKTDPTKILRAAREGIRDLKAFQTEIAKWLTA